MEIKTKYNIGDKVMVLADSLIKQTCPFCHGKGKLEVNGTVLYCQNCESGMLTHRGDIKHLVEGIITKVQVEVEFVEDAEDIFDSWYYQVKDNIGVREEYSVKIDNKLYWSNAQHVASQVFPVMTQQQFVLSDGTKPKLHVALQKSRNYPATMIGYQISQVVVIEDQKALYKWIYEEIDLSTDFVIHARYMGEDNIRKNYPWVFE